RILPPSDLPSFPTRRSSDLVDRRHVRLELLDTRRADQRRRDTLVAHDPRERQLRKRLTPALRDLVQRTNLAQRLFVDPVARERRSEEHTSELQSLAYLVCRL